jgi:hypothetical protein
MTRPISSTAITGASNASAGTINPTPREVSLARFQRLRTGLAVSVAVPISMAPQVGLCRWRMVCGEIPQHPDRGLLQPTG